MATSGGQQRRDAGALALTTVDFLIQRVKKRDSPPLSAHQLAQQSQGSVSWDPARRRLLRADTALTPAADAAEAVALGADASASSQAPLAEWRAERARLAPRRVVTLPQLGRPLSVVVPQGVSAAPSSRSSPTPSADSALSQLRRFIVEDDAPQQQPQPQQQQQQQQQQSGQQNTSPLAPQQPVHALEDGELEAAAAAPPHARPGVPPLALPRIGSGMPHSSSDGALFARSGSGGIGVGVGGGGGGGGGGGSAAPAAPAKAERRVARVAWRDEGPLGSDSDIDGGDDGDGDDGNGDDGNGNGNVAGEEPPAAAVARASLVSQWLQSAAPAPGAAAAAPGSRASLDLTRDARGGRAGRSSLNLARDAATGTGAPLAGGGRRRPSQPLNLGDELHKQWLKLAVKEAQQMSSSKPTAHG